MLVIHGLWSAGGLQVWAEDARTVTVAARRPGRRPAVATHPFAAAPQLLRAALPVSAVGAGEAVLLLPTRAGLPGASPELPAEQDDAPRPRAATAVTAGRWRVPVLEF